MISIENDGETWLARLAKRIQAIRQNPKNVSSRKLISVLKSFGFEKKGGKGSHQTFTHPELPNVILTIPNQNPLKVVYVQKVLQAIQPLLEAENNGE